MNRPIDEEAGHVATSYYSCRSDGENTSEYMKIHTFELRRSCEERYEAINDHRIYIHNFRACP